MTGVQTCALPIYQPLTNPQEENLRVFFFSRPIHNTAIQSCAIVRQDMFSVNGKRQTDPLWSTNLRTFSLYLDMSDEITAPQANTFAKQVTVSTRVTISDSLQLARRAKEAGLSKSAFVRQAALTGTIQPQAEIHQINEQHWQALAGMGANLNQLAAHLNAGGYSADGQPGLLEECRRLLADVRASLIGAEGGCHGVSD